MSLNTVHIFIGTFLWLCGSTVVSAAVSKPTNVRLTSYNMDLVLRWDPPEGGAGHLYTAQINSVIRTIPVCVNVSSTLCDFSHLNVSVYGSYTGQVMALLGDENSSWVKSNKITPDLDTVIGPPNVTLVSEATAIEVSIRDPEFATSTLKDVYSISSYNITYWKEGQRDKARSVSDVQQDRAILSDLEVSTRYCVQVQVQVNARIRSSEKSPHTCVSTKNDPAPWAGAVATFFVLAGVVALVAVTVAYWSSISHFLCPRDMLPSHLKEYLLAPPTLVVQVWNYSPPVEVFHQVRVLTPERARAEGERLLVEDGESCSNQPEATVEEEEEAKVLEEEAKEEEKEEQETQEEEEEAQEKQ